MVPSKMSTTFCVVYAKFNFEGKHTFMSTKKWGGDGEDGITLLLKGRFEL
jgi:hypothetical protein